MDFILKTLSPQMLIMLLPMILLKIGNWFKNKDADNVGSDDAVGNILIALAPAVSAMDEKNENALKKALRVVYTTIGGYLGEK